MSTRKPFSAPREKRFIDWTQVTGFDSLNSLKEKGLTGAQINDLRKAAKKAKRIQDARNRNR